MWRRLVFILLLWACQVQPYYDDAGHLDSPYNGTDHYIDTAYGYDSSYFATNLQDPYDFSKSWSIEGDEQRLAATLGYHGDPDAADTEGSAAAAAAGGMVTNELYVYDNCVLDADGKPVVNGTRDCALEIRGVDLAADLLAGGVDGVYRLSGCFDGKPLYMRHTSDGAVDRCLFFSTYLGDWELSTGPEPNEDDLVMYGDMGAVSPLDVLNWHVSAAYSSTESLRMPEGEDLYFVSPRVSVACEGEEPPARPKQDTVHAQAHAYAQAYAQAYGQPYAQVYAQAYAQAYGQEGQAFGQAYGQAPGGADQEARQAYVQRAHGEEAVGVGGADAAAAYAAAAAAQAQGQGQGAFYAYVGADGKVHYAGQYAAGAAAVQGRYAAAAAGQHHAEAAAHDAFPVGDALAGHDATAARDPSADHDTLADDDASDAYEAYIDAGYAILEHYRAHSPQLSKHGARYKGRSGKGRSYPAAGEAGRAEDDSLYYADHDHSDGQEMYQEEYEEEGSERSSQGGH